MMRFNNIKFSTTFDRAMLVATLRVNLKEHDRILEEAREGYRAAAQKALAAAAARLAAGEVVPLTFNLAVPPDHGECYRTVIDMLDQSTASDVTLNADEFRQLVRNEWDWTDGFFAVNRQYSKLADDVVSSKPPGR